MIEFIHRPLLSSLTDYPTDWHPLLRRIYASRLHHAEEFSKSLDALPPPQHLPGTEAAARILLEQARNGGRVLVIGDYDVDGVTATALSIKALRRLNIRCDACIPNRAKHGYGLSPTILQEVCTSDPPDWILTVDNGITAHEAVDIAKQAGIGVIISDHHLPAETLPAADIIINPRLGNTPVSANLSGVGVAFYLFWQCSEYSRAMGRRGLELHEFLDLVALGTIADVMPLDQHNRILVSHGLAMIRAGRAAPGIAALCDVAAKDAEVLSAQDIAFGLAPRLNAAGRIADMELGLACLLAEDPATALEAAMQLDELNRRRRHMENDAMSAALHDLPKDLPPVLNVYQAHGHEGISGIIAARLQERFHRPVMVFVDAQEDGMRKASGRAAPPVDLHELLNAVHNEAPHLRFNFGGHAAACGLRLATADWEEFCQVANACCLRLYQGKHASSEQLFDDSLSPDLFSIDWADYLERLEPWGKDLPIPCFVNEFEVLQYRVLGDHHSRYRLRELSGGQAFDALMFFKIHELPIGSRIRAAFELHVNRYGGRETLNLMLQAVQTL